MVRAELNGEQAPDLVVEKTEIEFSGGTYVVRFDRRESDSGSYELGGSRDRWTIILHGATGPNAGRTVAGIYQLAGDRIRICYGFDGTVPEAFTTSPADRHYLAIYRRKRVQD